MKRALSSHVASFFAGKISLWSLSERALGEAREELLLRLVLGEYLVNHVCPLPARVCYDCLHCEKRKACWQEMLLDIDAHRFVGRQAAKAMRFGAAYGRPARPTAAQTRGTAIHQAIERELSAHESGTKLPAPGDDSVDAILAPLRKLGLLLALVLPLGCEATGPRPLDLPPPDAARAFDLARADRAQPGPDLLELVDLAEPALPPDLAAPAVDLSTPPDLAPPAPDISAPPDMALACYPSRSYCGDPARVACCVAGQLCVGVSTFPPQECRSSAGGWCASTLDCAPGRLTCSGGTCLPY